jgi:diacylglycerol kinase family enzyme
MKRYIVLLFILLFYTFSYIQVLPFIFSLLSKIQQGSEVIYRPKNTVDLTKHNQALQSSIDGEYTMASYMGSVP